MSRTQILHVSDLHISAGDDFDRSVVLGPLVDRVCLDRKSGFNPEIVIVTGDIANTGINKEYNRAKVFFDNLLAALSLPDDRLFIVPGNHDVFRDEYNPSEKPSYKSMTDLNKELEIKKYRNTLLRGMENYFTFIETHYSHLTSQNPRLVPFVYSYKCECEKHIGLVGLNSAWMCRKSSDEKEIAIGEYQVKKAVEELEGKGSHDLVVNIFHHPLDWLWPEDRKICRTYLNRCLLLSGHLHDAEAANIQDLNGQICQIYSGAAYKDSKYKNQFHYLTLDWDNGAIKPDFRKYNKNRTWSEKGGRGADGTAAFYMPGRGPWGPDLTTTIEQANIFKKYKQATLLEHRHLPTQGFETRLEGAPIELDQIYVQMRARIHMSDFDLTLEGIEGSQARHEREQPTPMDLKGAFDISNRRQVKDMVILGHPGSGKTTLLQYILVMLIQGKGKDRLGIEEDLIPFFAPLRELKEPKKKRFLPFIMEASSLRQHPVPESDLKKLLDDGKGIILFDGLDEVANEQARLETCQWIDEALVQFPRTRFVITSRYAGYREESRLKKSHFELGILNFNLGEVETFLINWFKAVEMALHPLEDKRRWLKEGRERAQKLYEEISESKHLRELGVNPLLLQIMALVHRIRGELPERRVDLYKECTDILLEKWDKDKDIDVPLKAAEAREILEPLALWFHQEDERRSAPMKKIRKVIAKPLEEIGKSELNSERFLLNIRDRSGIFMGYNETEYGFAHHSFQEYLTAERIRNLGQVQTLVDNWGNEWWREVIRLCLALEKPAVIEETMKILIPTSHFKEEIQLVMDCLKDCIGKPAHPFIAAMQNPELPFITRSNAVRALSAMGGEEAIRSLKEIMGDKNQKLRLAAFEAIKVLGAAEGIEDPVTESRTFTNSKDDSEMVLVPAGTFLCEIPVYGEFRERYDIPQRVINLKAFYIDKFPVTNAQYCRFLNIIKPDRVNLEEWINLEGSSREDSCKIKGVKGSFKVEKGYERHPVIYVSWFGAHAYAKWAAKRLPTEEEWEKAARGTQGRIYPWGDTFDAVQRNAKDRCFEGTTQVDAFPECRSPYGCLNMVGNVWEWTDSWCGDRRCRRGSSWDDCANDYRRNDNMQPYPPSFRYFNTGFRCARTL